MGNLSVAIRCADLTKKMLTDERLTGTDFLVDSLQKMNDLFSDFFYNEISPKELACALDALETDYRAFLRSMSC